MTEVKVNCECGQRYKFEVEPVNGQMPYAVTCPVCGFDGTKKANEILHQMATAPPAPAAPVPAAAPAVRVRLPADAEQLPVAALASAAAAPAPAAAPPPPPPATALGAQLVTAPSAGEKPKLRISKTAHAEEPAAGPAESAGHAPAPVARPRPVPGLVRPAKETSGRKPNFALGLLGGLVGAVLGALIFYALFAYADFRIGLVGILTGFLAGLGAHLLGGKQEGHELGVITATLSVVGILGAQYFAAKLLYREEQDSYYKESVAEAKEVVAAIPTGSDQEIRAYLEKDLDLALVRLLGGGGQATQIPPELINEFREQALPEFRDLASGKITREQFLAKDYNEGRAPGEKEVDVKEEEEKNFKWFFLDLLFDKVSLVSMAAAAGLAYKMNS